MSRVTAAVFAMGERGHFKRMLPIIDGLMKAGVRMHVFTDGRFREDVARTGANFIDLFAGHTVEDADATSTPIPCRFVTFAGMYGDLIAKEAARLRPSLVVHDSFAVIGQVVANHLGVARVSVCAGHNLAPVPTLEALGRDPRVRLDARCRLAVQALKDRHGMADASPFSYVSTISPNLNLYCEPPQFLRPEARAPFEPIAFFGSLWPEGAAREKPAGSAFGHNPRPPTRVYASFGTVVWRYYQDAALAAFKALAEALANRTDAEGIVSLGGAHLATEAAALKSPNVRIEHYSDQWQILRDASVYMTHQGLNSTHEAVYHCVPMISYPFFSDQPGLAARCQELGLAVPLVDTLRGGVSASDVHAALDRIAVSRTRMKERLAIAREWEIEIIRERPAVIDRMIGLAS